MTDQAAAVESEASDSQLVELLDKRFNPSAADERPQEEAQPEATEEPGTDQEATDEEPGDEPTEEGQEGTQPDLSAVKVPVTYKGDDGSDITEELPLEEIRSGYMRQRDYTAKTQEVSRARAAIPLAVEQGVSEARNQYVQSLQQFQALVQTLAAPELVNVDWQKLAQENPAEYVAKSARAQQIQGVLQALAQNQEGERQRVFAATKQAAEQEARQSVELLKTAIPNFSAEKYQGLIQGAVKEYGKYGLKTEEVAGITGAVPFIVIHDALAYRALMAKKPGVTNKVNTAPVAIKPGASKTRADAVNARTKPLQERLAKTGDLQDAVALYSARQRRA